MSNHAVRSHIALQSSNERVFREAPVLTTAYENQGHALACIFSATKSVWWEKEKTKSMREKYPNSWQRRFALNVAH